LAIIPEKQKQSIGTRLLKHTENELRNLFKIIKEATLQKPANRCVNAIHSLKLIGVAIPIRQRTDYSKLVAMRTEYKNAIV
jgi:hypothetical protein